MLTLSSATTSKSSRTKRLLTLRTRTIGWAMLSPFYELPKCEMRIAKFSISQSAIRNPLLDLHAISITQFVSAVKCHRFVTTQTFQNLIVVSDLAARPDRALFDLV